MNAYNIREELTRGTGQRATARKLSVSVAAANRIARAPT